MGVLDVAGMGALLWGWLFSEHPILWAGISCLPFFSTSMGQWDLPYRGDPIPYHTLDRSSPPLPILNPEGCSRRLQEKLVSAE